MNRQAVVATIPVTDPADPNNTVTAWLSDLKVGDYRIDDTTQRLVLGTGSPAALGLVIVNPVTQTIVEQQALSNDEGSLASGQAIALTHLGGRDLAIVGGYGTVGNAGAAGVVAVVDLSPLAATPQGTPGVIAWVALTHGVGDILVFGTTAIVSAPSSNALAAQGTATLINLADPYNPINAGILSGVGSRLAVADNVLVSTDRTLLKTTPGQLGGMRTAGLGTLILITEVSPAITSVDDQGLTQEPIRVKYRVLAGPQEATGNIHLFQTESPSATTSTPLLSLPLPSVQDGVHEVELPAGLALDLPSRDLRVEVTLPDGTVESFLTTIRNLAPAPFGGSTANPPANGNAAEFVPIPTFLGLTPKVVGEGAPLTRFTIDGTTLGGITRVQVRRADVWSELRVASATATTLTVDLPTELAADSGFLLVAPVRDETRGIPLMVAARNLPAPAPNETLSLTNVGDDGVIRPGQTTVKLTGQGFAPGMQAVFGLGDRPAVVLATQFVSDTELQATLPPTFLGESDDLVAGVLAPNGGALSTLLPLRSHYPDPVDALIDVAQAREDAGETVEPTVWSMDGTLHWNSANERLEFEGLGLAPGLEVQFTPVTDAPALRAARALAPITGVTIASNNAPSRDGLTRVSVAVPRELTGHPFFTIGASMQQPGQAAQQSAPAAVPVAQPLSVPLGGRGAFHVYSDAERKRVFLLASDDPTRPYPGDDARPPLQRLAASDFTFTITTNPRKPSGLTVVRQEKDSNDKDGVFLRGTGLTAGVGAAKLSVALSAQPQVTTEVNANVVKKALGNKKDGGHYEDLITVADQFGVPPQFLKAQAERESQLFQINLRYEPMTRDFAYMGGTGSQVISSKGTRHIVTQPWLSYRQLGAMLRHPLVGAAQTFRRAANTDGRTFSLGVAVVRSLSTVPSQACAEIKKEDKDPAHPKKLRLRYCNKWADEVKDAAVTAEIRKDGQPLNTAVKLDLVHTQAIWRKVETPHKLAPQGWLQPAAVLNDKRFTIDYATGGITLGRALAADESLVVTYNPLPSTPADNTNVQPVPVGSGEGTYAADFFTPAQATAIKETVKLKYTRSETLGAFLSNNIQNTGKMGSWLTGTWSERNVEFTVDAAGKPIEPLDPKFAAMTANPAPASSYGSLQVLLDDYALDAKKDLLKAVLDPEKTSMYALFTDWLLGLKLGAAIHQRAYVTRKDKAPCKETETCTTDAWNELWHEILTSYRSWRRRLQGLYDL